MGGMNSMRNKIVYDFPDGVKFPDGSEPSKEVYGEWLVRNNEWQFLRDLRHPTGFASFYLVEFNSGVNFICVLRWGRKKCRFQVESKPCQDFDSALYDACSQANEIPVIEDDNWLAIIKDSWPYIAITNVDFENVSIIGRPRITCRLHLSGGVSVCTTPTASMREAFNSLCSLLRESNFCVDNYPIQDHWFSAGKLTLLNVNANLQDLIGSPVVTTQFAEKRSDGKKYWGLRASWHDVDGVRRKITTKCEYLDSDEAVDKLSALIRDVLMEGPSLTQEPVRRILNELKIKFSGVLVEYRGDVRPICRITVKGLGQVESNASLHRAGAYRDALKLIEKLALRHTLAPSVELSGEPSVANMKKWLDFAKSRWLEEREFLMANKEIKEADRRRLIQLSLYLALLEPLRKYEFAPSQRKSISSEIVGEISQTLLRNSPIQHKANMVSALRLLAGCAYCDPGFKITINDNFYRQIFLLRDSPSKVLEELLSSNLLRNEVGNLKMSTLGANLMEHFMRAPHGKLSTLGATLPIEILQMLNELQIHLANPSD